MENLEKMKAIICPKHGPPSVLQLQEVETILLIVVQCVFLSLI